MPSFALHANPADQRLTGTVIDMARHFEFITVAEGVEQEAQLERPMDMGCDLVQGFMFAPPLKEDALFRLMKTGFAHMPARSAGGGGVEGSQALAPTVRFPSGNRRCVAPWETADALIATCAAPTENRRWIARNHRCPIATCVAPRKPPCPVGAAQSRERSQGNRRHLWSGASRE